MKIITISGLDGSGKSTQVVNLKKYLLAQNKKVFSFHSIQFSLAQKIIKWKKQCPLLHCKLKKQLLKTNLKSITKATPFQIFLRKIFLIIDLWRFKLLCHRLINKRYDYLLSDRYFYDNLINIKFLSFLTQKNYWDKLFSLILIIPNMAIYLQTNPENIIQREKKPDQGIEYLIAKKKLYDNYFSHWNMKLINGNQEPKIIFEQIKNHVKKLS